MKQSYEVYGYRVKVYNKHLSAILMVFCLTLLLFHNTDKVDFSTIFVFSTFLTLGLSGILLFKLSQEKAARHAAEFKSQMASARLASIYDASIVGLLYTRFDGVITEANDAFLKIIGYTRSDLENGKISWIDMTPPEYAEISQFALAQLKTSGICEPFAKEYWRKDGSKVSVLLGSSLLTGGDKAQIFTYAIDITNLKETEKREQELTLKIRHQQQQMFRILNNAPIAIVIRKGPELKTEYVNQTALNYTSFERKNVLGKTAEEFHQELKTDHNSFALMDVYRSGKAVTGKAQHVKYDRLGTGDLQERWFNYVWEPIYDQHGNVEGVVTFTFEVSDLVRANKELIANEERFRFIANAIPHKMWTSAADGLVTYYNKGWTDYLQETDLDRLRVKAWEAIHPEELEEVKRIWEETIENGTDMEMEQRLRRYDGVYQWHLTRVCSCRDENGRVTMYVGSSTNIHEQKMAEIAMRLSMEKKDEFLGIATHELRTPITSMKTALQSLDRSVHGGGTMEKALPLVTLANKQINKLAAIVNDLVDVDKIQSGKLFLTKTIFKLSDSVNEVISHIELQQPEYQFIIEANDDEPVDADKIRIESVLINLLTNAIKYSPQEKTVLVLIEKNSDEVKCSVIDKGIGIPADLQQYVFDRFFRVHASSQQFSGLGLGLYISAEIIRRHGGNIGLESEERKGSVFWFTLPIAKN